MLGLEIRFPLELQTGESRKALLISFIILNDSRRTPLPVSLKWYQPRRKGICNRGTMRDADKFLRLLLLFSHFIPYLYGCGLYQRSPAR